ncbi:hypothetical protein AVEN_230094-1 [Araneus ventricosus]|uniref:Uncharacterized protein n=1 Tax=Araneus ventricosus TaxID=182803 RepID=A0A4Y2IJL7_ARAVE|nr:hypothetical protein AVEN_230094-1 [Araneus ventricosus]
MPLPVLLTLPKAGHSRERKAKPFAPTTGLYSTHFSRKIRQIIHGSSKVCCETRFKVVDFLPHGGFRFSFLASTRGPNLGKTFVVPLPSQRGPQKTIRPFQSDFKLFGIPTLPIFYANCHRLPTLTIGFSVPCSKNSRVERPA